MLVHFNHVPNRNLLVYLNHELSYSKLNLVAFDLEVDIGFMLPNIKIDCLLWLSKIEPMYLV